MAKDFYSDAPVRESKYAARQRKARENAAKEEAANAYNNGYGNDYDRDSARINHNRNYRRYDGYRNNNNNRPTKHKGLPEAATKYPEHVVGVAMLVKNNAEIRRFTALGILRYLREHGDVNTNAEYVQFKYNKFAVKSNGLMREYPYTEKFFLDALVAAFFAFSHVSQTKINKFMEIELNKSYDDINMADVKDIVDDNIAHQDEITSVTSDDVNDDDDN